MSGRTGQHLRREFVKAEVESLPCLCATSWKREGLLEANHAKKGLWEWTAGDIFERHRQSIAYELRTGDMDGVLRLSYRYKDEHLEYNIPLLTRPEPWGGRRWYWGCPIVGHESRSPYERSTRLYRHGKYFGCRFCLRLCYKSQNEGKKLERWSRRFGVDLRALEDGHLVGQGWHKGCWVGGNEEIPQSPLSDC